MRRRGSDGQASAAQDRAAAAGGSSGAGGESGKAQALLQWKATRGLRDVVENGLEVDGAASGGGEMTSKIAKHNTTARGFAVLVLFGSQKAGT